jgi:hypothetical protein
MKYLLALIVCLSHTNVWSDNTFIKAGGTLNGPSYTTAKMLTFGREGPLLGVFDYQAELGYFGDSVSQTHSLLGGASLGISIVKPDYYVKVFFGPAFITATDYRLSSVYEFNTDVQIGFIDKNKSIGIGIKHISNAGLQSPNLGRDFLYLKVGF